MLQTKLLVGNLEVCCSRWLFCPQKVNPFIPSYLITYNMQCLDSLLLLAEK